MAVFGAISSFFYGDKEDERPAPLDTSLFGDFTITRLFLPNKAATNLAVAGSDEPTNVFSMFSLGRQSTKSAAVQSGTSIFDGLMEIFSETSNEQQNLNAVKPPCDGLFQCIGESFGKLIGAVETPINHGATNEDILDDILYDPMVANVLILVLIVVACLVVQRFGLKITDGIRKFAVGYEFSLEGIGEVFKRGSINKQDSTLCMELIGETLVCLADQTAHIRDEIASFKKPIIGKLQQCGKTDFNKLPNTKGLDDARKSHTKRRSSEKTPCRIPIVADSPKPISLNKIRRFDGTPVTIPLSKIRRFNGILRSGPTTKIPLFKNSPRPIKVNYFNE